jgi:hypothetical protein
VTRGLAALALGLGCALTACSSASTQPDAAEPSPSETSAGPVTRGVEASCVESYSAEGVARRAFAFDGEVVDTGPSVTDRGGETDLGLPGVTFAVHEWFRGGPGDQGGQGDTVTVDFQGVDEEPSETALAAGTRLLVSGEPRWGGPALEAPIAWSCGFTRRYDEATAADRREATRR